MRKTASFKLLALSRKSTAFALLAIMGCSQWQGQAQRDVENGGPELVRVQETFALGQADNWRFRTPELWSILEDEGRPYLQVAEPPQRPMLPGVRRPQEYAIFTPYEFRSFSLSCFMRVDRDPAVKARDACIIFGRRDDTHFYYAHLAGASDGVHNTVMRVDGDTRQRLMPDGFRPEPIFTDRTWHKVDVLRNCDTGLTQIFVDAYDPAAATPYFEFTDKTYEWGHLAIGSFDDHASFANVLIEGQARQPASPPTADGGE